MSDRTHEINFVEPEFELRDYLFGINRVVGMFLRGNVLEKTFTATACVMRREGKRCFIEKIKYYKLSGDDPAQTYKTIAGFGWRWLPVIVYYEKCEMQGLPAKSNSSLAENLGAFLQVQRMTREDRVYDVQFLIENRKEMLIATITYRELDFIKMMCRFMRLRLLVCGLAKQEDTESPEPKDIFFSLANSDEFTTVAVEHDRDVYQAIMAARTNLNNLSGPIKPKFPKVKKEVQKEEPPTVLAPSAPGVFLETLMRELEGKSSLRDEVKSAPSIVPPGTSVEVLTFQSNDSGLIETTRKIIPGGTDISGAFSETQAIPQEINPDDEKTVADVTVDPDFPDVDENLLVDTRDLEGKENTDEFGGGKEGSGETPKKE